MMIRGHRGAGGQAHRLCAGLVVAFLLLSGCGAPSSDQTAVAPVVQITLAPAPEGAQGESLTVTLADRAGKPITDATVSLEGNMTHAGMVPVAGNETRDDADGAADGRYRVPFRFSMNGDWIITVVVELPDGATVQQDIEVNVAETGVTVK